MRSLFLSLCFLFTILLAYSHVSYSAEFSYDLDRVTQVGGVLGTDTFVDEFDDDVEPPSGPSGPTTYSVPFPFSSDAESGGLLNLNSKDADSFPIDDNDMDIIINIDDNTFFFNSGSGGRLEGKFRFPNGITKNTDFCIGIVSSHSVNSVDSEELFLCITRLSSDSIVAEFDYTTESVEKDISLIDITDSLQGITDITIRLDISTADVVTASLDFGSDGTYDLTMPASQELVFIPGETYTGQIGASTGCPDCDLIVNPDGSMDIFLANDCNKVSIPIELKLWAELSDQIFSLLNVGSDGSIVLPPGFQMTVNVSPPGSVPSGLNLVLGLRFVDPVTGEQLCVDTELVP